MRGPRPLVKFLRQVVPAFVPPRRQASGDGKPRNLDWCRLSAISVDEDDVFVLHEGIPPLPKTWSSLLRNGERHSPARHRAVYSNNTEMYIGTVWILEILDNNTCIIICLYRARENMPLSKAKRIQGRDRSYILGTDWLQQNLSPRGTSDNDWAEAESIHTSSCSSRVRRACVIDTRPESNKWSQYRSAC